VTNSRPSGGNGSGDERACDHSNRRTKIQTELAEPDPLARMAGPFSGILDQDVVTPKFVAWDSNWNFPKFLRSHPARPGNYVTVTESGTPRRSRKRRGGSPTRHSHGTGTRRRSPTAAAYRERSNPSTDSDCRRGYWPSLMSSQITPGPDPTYLRRRNAWSTLCR
jgi:hypothetical protein